MSRVYRYDELVAAPLPSPERFGEELAYTRQALGELCTQELISGALLFGSAVTATDASGDRDINPRSDIDIMISTPNMTIDVLNGVRAMTTGVYERSRIPTDVACFSEEDLSSGRHNYFSDHLLLWFRMLTQRNPESIVGQNPLEITVPAPGDVLVRIDNSLAERTHAFETNFMRGHLGQPEHALEEVLNYPHKVARQALGALLVRGRIPADTITNAKKLDVVDALQRLFGAEDPAITAISAELVRAFGDYTAFADAVYGGGISRREYDFYIQAAAAQLLPQAAILAGKVHRVYRAFAGLGSSQMQEVS